MRAAAIAALLSAAGVLIAASSASAAMKVSVRELLADPPRFKGKTVQLRVVVDQCSPYNCHVCDEGPAPRACIGVGRWRVEGLDPEDGRMALSAEAGVRQFYRFTTVTVTARFYLHTAKDEADAARQIAEAEASIPGLNIDPSGPRVGARWLDAVEVLKLERRWAPMDGIVMDDDDKPLLTPSDEVYREMIKAVQLYLGPPEGKANEGPAGPRAYLAEDHEGGWVCTQDRGGSLGDWPTKVGHLWPTPSAWYDCVTVSKNRDGRWAVVAGGL
jgi:hypothetical protein